jgi:hypothetical protein
VKAYTYAVNRSMSEVGALNISEADAGPFASFTKRVLFLSHFPFHGRGIEENDWLKRDNKPDQVPHER